MCSFTDIGEFGMSYTFAARLRSCRIGLRLTQAELATRLNVSRSAVAQWESDSGSLPSTASFTSLAATLACSFEWLATGRGQRTLDSGAVPETSAAAAVDFRFFARDDAEEQLMAGFRDLDSHDRDIVSTLVASLQARPRFARRREAA